jgi:di/tricarboxylate transporter
MADINFVRQRLKKLTKLEKKDKEIFKTATIITSVLLLIFAAILGYKLYLTSQLKEIESSQKIFLDRIEQQEEREKSFVLFVNKLRVLSGVFQKRKDKQEAIGYFSQIFGADVIIEKIAYDDNSQLLTFRLMAADIFTLEKVFELLSTQQSTQKFSSLTKSGLKRTNNGIYQMQITVVMGEEKQ